MPPKMVCFALKTASLGNENSFLSFQDKDSAVPMFDYRYGASLVQNLSGGQDSAALFLHLKPKDYFLSFQAHLELAEKSEKQDLFFLELQLFGLVLNTSEAYPLFAVKIVFQPSPILEPVL